MICNANDFAVTGATVCGRTFRPAAEDSSYAVYRLDNCACGVTVEKGKSRYYLRITPGVQMPAETRAGFERFQFECDDDELVDLDLDLEDGELVLRRDLRSDAPEDVEDALKPALEWVDRVAYPAIMAFIAQTYRELDEK